MIPDEAIDNPEVEAVASLIEEAENRFKKKLTWSVDYKLLAEIIIRMLKACYGYRKLEAK